MVAPHGVGSGRCPASKTHVDADLTVSVCVCMCMYVYVLYVCVCIMSVSVLYLYVWPRFSFNTPQSPWKASWGGGTDRAGLSTPRGMCPYHFAGIWGR